jgi:N-acetylmuramoyl-L-alanine amidase
MRCITLFSMIITLSLLGEICVFSQEKTHISKVVIDAGHGGKDPGTIGKKSQEKNVALQIALKLSEEIRSKCKGVTVICTRTTDEFIELHERAEIANRSKADLFISIHCNANPKHSFLGAETYVMGLHRTEANLEIAKKENAAILMEPDYSTNYNGFDPNSDESYITFTLFQNAFLEQSTRFASFVQDEMKDRVGMNDRGVRQAGFLVLYKTTMPSVLIETGFLSNPEEEKFLMSEKGQQYIAAAICRAFCKFKAKWEGNGKELASAGDKKVPVPPASITKQAENPVNKDTSVKPKEKQKEKTSAKDTVKLQATPKPAPTGQAVAGTSQKPAEKKSAKENTGAKTTSKNVSVKKDSVPPKVTSAANPPIHEKTTAGSHEKSISAAPDKGNAAKSKAVVKSQEAKPVPATVSNDVVFRVQFATSPKELSVHSKKFEGLPDVWKYQHQGLYKYTIGKESTPEALSALLAKAKDKGFKDAFIVAFHGSERITVAEGRKLIGR